MEADIDRLTFLENPQAYRAQAGEVCALVPAGISSPEKLTTVLKESLAFPEDVADWHALSDALCNWDKWTSIPQRIVILHRDLPLLRSGRLWWLNVQGYLYALLESIAMFERRKALEPDSLKHKELVVMFPAQVYDELRAVLTRPPAWELTMSFFDPDDFYEFQIDPSQSTILHYLESLNGVTSEICALSRADLGKITTHYNKYARAYCALYETPEQQTWMVASEKEELVQPPQISFAQASQIMETFFAEGERSTSLHWLELSAAAYDNLLNKLKRSYYRSDEEVRVEKDMNRTRSTVGQGLKEVEGKEEEAYSLAYWQEVLTRSETSLSQRLAALCAIGLSTLAEAPALLRPFLQSPVKQERWISARFCGLWQNDEALPVLLSMLTDELPLATRKHEQEDDYYWYNDWRRYAPRLLRKWQTPEVGRSLHKALAVWVQAEAQFDPDDAQLWELFEGEICYELGYRGDITMLYELPLEQERKQALSYQVEQGKKAREQDRREG